MTVRARALAAAALAALALPAAGGAALGPQLDRALHVPHVSASASAAFAIDLSTGETVYSRNASLPLLPASNEKLAVTYAALTALGPSFAIETDALGEVARTVEGPDVSRFADELSALAKRITHADGELSELRSLLGTLHERTRSIRVAARAT